MSIFEKMTLDELCAAESVVTAHIKRHHNNPVEYTKSVRVLAKIKMLKKPLQNAADENFAILKEATRNRLIEHWVAQDEENPMLYEIEMAEEKRLTK